MMLFLESILAADIYNQETGEIFGEAGDEIDEKLLDLLEKIKYQTFKF